jgi:hypothetical protein
MYRTNPAPDSGPSPTSRTGDLALLIAIVVVGALPFAGWALQYDVARWELGLGTAVILCAGAELLRELAMRGKNDTPHPENPDP